MKKKRINGSEILLIKHITTIDTSKIVKIVYSKYSNEVTIYGGCLTHDGMFEIASTDGYKVVQNLHFLLLPELRAIAKQNRIPFIEEYGRRVLSV